MGILGLAVWLEVIGGIKKGFSMINRKALFYVEKIEGQIAPNNFRIQMTKQIEPSKKKMEAT